MESLQTVPSQSWLSWFFRGILFLGLFILFARVFELQVIKGEYYHNLAEGNRIRRVPITAARGKVYASGGEVLVDNISQEFTVSFNSSGFAIAPVKDDTPGEERIVLWRRFYPLGDAFGHISGYLGEVNENEAGKVDSRCIEKGVRSMKSLVGRGGLEETYGCTLRGQDGEDLVEVDTIGKRVRTLGRLAPVPGTDLYTNINYALQKKVAEVMQGVEGAVVATKPSGEVLALYSSPSFDPNIFVASDQEKISSVLTSPALPLFNRAIGGLYHPGSVFKIITSTAALESGVVSRKYKYTDTGTVTVNDFSYTNWYFTQYGGTEGEIDLSRALARSTDTLFYEVAGEVGPDRLSGWAKQFGLGDKTGIDLPGEVAGLVPTPEWKKAIKGERWFLGNTYHLGIGQGDLIVTPLAANRIAAVIANGGQLCEPKINKGLPTNCKDLDIKPDNLNYIKEGMTAACSAGGTAYPFFDFPVKVACKTGTAETFEKDITHAWFSIFAPLDNPEIVLTVLVEKGGEGSKVAAPIAKEILSFMFEIPYSQNEETAAN